MGFGSEPLATINLVFHLGIDIMTSGIAEMEGHLGITLCEHLFCNVNAQSRLTVT